MSETNEIVITVDDELLAEIGYGVIGRAQDIHENPDDDNEDIALDLRNIGQAILAEADVEPFETDERVQELPREEIDSLKETLGVNDV